MTTDIEQTRYLKVGNKLVGPLLPDENTDDIRLDLVAECLAILSPYSPDEARAILKSIIACEPVSEISRLLICSPGHKRE
jgi:hypothetical protein